MDRNFREFVSTITKNIESAKGDIAEVALQLKNCYEEIDDLRYSERIHSNRVNKLSDQIDYISQEGTKEINKIATNFGDFRASVKRRAGQLYDHELTINRHSKQLSQTVSYPQELKLQLDKITDEIRMNRLEQDKIADIITNMSNTIGGICNDIQEMKSMITSQNELISKFGNDISSHTASIVSTENTEIQPDTMIVHPAIEEAAFNPDIFFAVESPKSNKEKLPKKTTPARKRTASDRTTVQSTKKTQRKKGSNAAWWDKDKKSLEIPEGQKRKVTIRCPIYY